MAEEKVTVGVDLGGTNVKIAVVSQDKEILERLSRPTDADKGPEAVMDVMERGIRDVLQAADRSLENVLAVGFGAPGPMDWQTGVVYSPPNLKGWKDVPLAQSMSQRLNVPCFVDNDANVACYGEYWLGAGQGAESMAVLTLGTGVGGGVVVFGELLRGIDGTAGELGHLKVQRNGRLCGCGSRGCLEAYASVTGLVRTAADAMTEGQPTSLLEASGGNPDHITPEMVFEAAQAGDRVAQWCYDETAAWLGLGIASIIHYQNPEKVVLCGGMIGAGELLLTPLRRIVKSNTFPVPGRRCEIVTAGLGADSGVIGAAGCALARLESGKP